MSVEPMAGGGVRPAALRHFTAEVLATPETVPVVIQFQQPPVVAYKAAHPLVTPMEVEAYAAQLQAYHQQFLHQLTALGMDARISSSKAVLSSDRGPVEVEVPHDFTYCYNGVGILLPGKVVAQVADLPQVSVITFNKERIYLNVNKSVPFTGAPRMWERRDTHGHQIMGQGVTIAVIDTGILVL